MRIIKSDNAARWTCVPLKPMCFVALTLRTSVCHVISEKENLCTHLCSRKLMTMWLWTLSCRGGRTGTLVPSWSAEPTCTRRGTGPRRLATKTPSTQTTRPQTGCITSEWRHYLTPHTQAAKDQVNQCLNLLLVLVQVFGVCVGGDWTQSQGKYYGCDS